MEAKSRKNPARLNRWIRVNAPHGGSAMVRERMIVEIRSIACDDNAQLAELQQRPMCPKAVHYSVTTPSGMVDITRDEAERLCGELGIDAGFLLPDSLKQDAGSISGKAN